MVNPNSVIPAWLNTYAPAAYVSLTDKEDWSYTLGQGQSIWLPRFTQLATALNSYKSFNRESEISNFFFNSYGYVSFNKLFGTSGSALASFDGYSIYDVNGFLAATIARPLNYYNDYVSTPVAGSARMTADLAAVNAAAAAETSQLSAISSPLHNVVQRFQVDLLWQDVPVLQPWSKADATNYFFIDLHWKNVYQNLNVGTLALPPSVQ